MYINNILIWVEFLCASIICREKKMIPPSNETGHCLWGYLGQQQLCLQCQWRHRATAEFDSILSKAWSSLDPGLLTAQFAKTIPRSSPHHSVLTPRCQWNSSNEFCSARYMSAFNYVESTASLMCTCCINNTYQLDSVVSMTLRVQFI
jgi:hypothetical protein